MGQRRAWLEQIGIPASAFILGILLWDFLARQLDINAIILPRPIEVLRELRSNSALLLKQTGITMLEAALGFIAGSLAAYGGAIVFVHSRTVERALYPYAVALKSTPLIAIAPLLVLWFGNGLLSKVIMAALVAFFPVLVNSVHGLSAIDEEAVHLMRSLAASRFQVLVKLRIPNSLPFLFSSLKIASSLAVVGAVIGEFTGSTAGIGHLINTSSYYLETALMFAGILLISLSGIAFFYLVSLCERAFVFWDPAFREE